MGEVGGIYLCLVRVESYEVFGVIDLGMKDLCDRGGTCSWCLS